MSDTLTWETDPEYTVYTLDKVEKYDRGYVIGHDGWCLSIDDPGFEPRVGDVARFYGRGLGYLVRGVVIEGRVAYYRTPAEQDEKDAASALAEKRRGQDAFLANKSMMDERFAALPPEFQRRIERFRTHCPSFRWEFEAYEMSSCVDAVKIAGHLRPQMDAVMETGDERLDATWEIAKAFGRLPWEEQLRRVPDLDRGHSGNTFGMALRLAWRYVVLPETVEREHAAIAPLVGCARVGCWHPAKAA